MAKAKKAEPKKAALKFPKVGKPATKAKAPKAPKAKAAKAAKAKTTPAAAAAIVQAAKARHATPKAKALPGFEQVVDTRLNDICQRISDNRAAANALRQEIDADSQAALDHMLKTHRPTYHHAGVELVVRPGAAKLSVRTFREDGATANLPEGEGPTAAQEADVEAEGLLEAGESFDDGDAVVN